MQFQQQPFQGQTQQPFQTPAQGQMFSAYQQRGQQLPQGGSAGFYLDRADKDLFNNLRSGGRRVTWNREHARQAEKKNEGKGSLMGASMTNAKGQITTQNIAAFPTRIWLEPQGTTLGFITWIDPREFAEHFALDPRDISQVYIDNGYPVFIYGTLDAIRSELTELGLFPSNASQATVNDWIGKNIISNNHLRAERATGGGRKFTLVISPNIANESRGKYLKRIVDKVNTVKKAEAGYHLTAERLDEILFITKNISNTAVLSENGKIVAIYNDQKSQRAHVENIFTRKLESLEKNEGFQKVDRFTIDVSGYGTDGSINASSSRTHVSERSKSQPVMLPFQHNGYIYQPGLIRSNNIKSLTMILEEIADASSAGKGGSGYYGFLTADGSRTANANEVTAALGARLEVVRKYLASKVEKVNQGLIMPTFTGAYAGQQHHQPHQHQQQMMGGATVPVGFGSGAQGPPSR